MGKREVTFRNFWPDGYVGHTSSDGKDIGKEFLRNFFSVTSQDFEIETIIHSHFFERSNLSKARELMDKISVRVNRNSIDSRIKLHGYQSRSYKFPVGAFNIWYTSENMRPPLSEPFDLFLSHDIDTYDGRNLYLPIWATRLGLNDDDATRVQEKMSKPREVDATERKGICAVISNPEPIRMAFIRELQKEVKVDIYGAFGKPVPDKDSVLKKYKINICFENDEFPGYVTEKPFEAWTMGCVPVWRGLDSAGNLNKNALVDVSQLGFSESISQIVKILGSDNEYAKMASEPILAKPYNFDNLRKKIEFIYSK